MTYAIVEASGTQLWLEAGRFYDVNRLDVPEDETVTLDKVLFVENEGEANVGCPYVEGASVEATVMGHLRGRKVIVYKMRPKKKTRRKQGHRQELTRILINSITLNGQVIASDDGAELLATDDAVSAPVLEAEETAAVVDADADEAEVEATDEAVETVEDADADETEVEASEVTEVEDAEETEAEVSEVAEVEAADDAEETEAEVNETAESEAAAEEED